MTPATPGLEVVEACYPAFGHGYPMIEFEVETIAAVLAAGSVERRTRPEPQGQAYWRRHMPTPRLDETQVLATEEHSAEECIAGAFAACGSIGPTPAMWHRSPS